jgi:hypothetical protein
MKILKVGGEYWVVPAGIDVRDHLEPGTRVIFLEKLPPRVVELSHTPEGIVKYKIDTSSKNAEYQRTFKKRMRDAGLVSVEIWVLPENKEQVREYARKL